MQNQTHYTKDVITRSETIAQANIATLEVGIGLNHGEVCTSSPLLQQVPSQEVKNQQAERVDSEDLTGKPTKQGQKDSEHSPITEAFLETPLNQAALRFGME